MKKNFIASVYKDKETGSYYASFPGIVGAHTVSDNLEELEKNLHEVLELCLEEMDDEDKALLPDFAGSMMISVDV
jgi:predicted RNase H-like HicB family nuclease